MFTLEGKKIWVAGHGGMVGSALMRRLKQENVTLLTASHAELDLCRQQEVEAWIMAQKPDAIFLAAAMVGGIHANSTRPAEFIYDNMMIEANVIHAAYKAGVSKLLFLGSSCIYPKFAPQPIVEDALLSGSLEPTNQWYAIAKIAGIKLCAAYRRQYGCDFISAMPTNLYGINDNFVNEMSHVIPALMRRIHEAKLQGAPDVTVWGSGTPRREFLFSEDLADGLVYLMQHYSDEQQVNLGCGEDVTIKELVAMMCDVVGYEGTITYDSSKPDGTPRKVLDVRVMKQMGWSYKTSLKQGLEETYRWFLSQPQESVRGFGAVSS
jgi:GDP-L-fucose synthase